MSTYRTLDEIAVEGKRVVIRVDLNVPMHNGIITDKTRIEKIAPTLRELTRRGADLVILAHFGRPKGRYIPNLSLKPIAIQLENILGLPVRFLTLKNALEEARPTPTGAITLIENIRFESGEEKNDCTLINQLAALGDIYVNDAFSCSHRAHASTYGITKRLPAAAGRFLEMEIRTLNNFLKKPKHPVVAIVGGSKVSTKLEILGFLLEKVDHLVIGGGMANTFLKAKGNEIGTSLCEYNMIELANEIMDRAIAASCTIFLPHDVVIARELTEGADTASILVGKVPSDMMILDIGPRSINALCELLNKSHTLLWNGPLGAFEISPFDNGTNRVALAAKRLTVTGKLMSIAGGGDTTAALRNASVASSFTYVSTAGGAFLEWLEGKELPGIKALEV